MQFNPSQRFVCQWTGLLAALFATMPGYAQSGNAACGSLGQGAAGYGPYDYRTDKPKLGIVEQYHFTPAVEALVRGSTNVLPGADLDYTLRAIPNHHRALMAMVRYGEKMKSPQPQGTRYSVECYFDRAVRFRPDDTIVRMLYATFLSKNARMPEAIQQLELATAAAKDNAFSHYNIGLVYFDLKEYDKALLQAHKALSLGFPQTVLRDQLQSVGKWTEPADLPVTPTAGNAPAEQPK
jgi:tetratricopeptide (TPR) repeat protein